MVLRLIYPEMNWSEVKIITGSKILLVAQHVVHPMYTKPMPVIPVVPFRKKSNNKTEGRKLPNQVTSSSQAVNRYREFLECRLQRRMTANPDVAESSSVGCYHPHPPPVHACVFCLQNDLFCVKWGIKSYLNQSAKSLVTFEDSSNDKYHLAQQGGIVNLLT